MTIKANFTMEGIYAYITQQTERGEKAIIQTFQFAGEQFVRDARLAGDYNDITGNLRSSIGYVILKDGNQLFDNFGQAGNGSDQATGVQIGIQVAEEVASFYPKGIALICVAGMKYAAAVEAKGREVITGTSLEIEVKLQQLLNAL